MKFKRVLCLLFAMILVSSSFSACKKGSGGGSVSSSSGTASTSKTSPSATRNLTGSATNKTISSTSKTSDTVSESDGSYTQDGQPGSRDDGTTIESESNDVSGSSGEIKESGKKIDLGGRKLVVASRNLPPELGQSAIGDITYRSWRNAEQKYNFVTEWKYVNGSTSVIAQEFTNAVMAGVHYADAVGLSSKQAFPTMADQGMILPIDEYVDFENDPLYNSDFCKTSALWRGKHYGFAGPAAASTYGYYYNRTIFSKEGLPDPQDLVDMGNWTWDTFLQAAIATTKDFNGDGIVDQWGISGHKYNEGTWLLFSNGCDIVYNENGRYVFGMSTPAAIRALQFYSDLWNVYKVIVHDGSSTQADIFIKGQSAMFAHATYTGKTLKDAGMTDYGFVVLPKGPDVNECQRVVDSTNFWAYPATLKNPREIVTIMCDILTTWDPSKPEHVTVEELLRGGAESYFVSQRDIDHYFKYVPSGKLLCAYSFADAMNIVSKNIVDPVSKMQVTAAAAVEANKDAAQASIDALVRQ